MATRRTITPVPIEPDEQFDFDLDLLVVEEETAPPFRFRWGGQVFQMPIMAAMKFEDQLALESMGVEESMRLIMGDDELDRLLGTKGGPGEAAISTGRMGELIKQWHRFQGLEPGESQASSRSSANTARRSRRTSRSGR